MRVRVRGCWALEGCGCPGRPLGVQGLGLGFGFGVYRVSGFRLRGGVYRVCSLGFTGFGLRVWGCRLGFGELGFRSSELTASIV